MTIKTRQYKQSVIKEMTKNDNKEMTKNGNKDKTIQTISYQ